jgi:hypothetical protein
MDKQKIKEALDVLKAFIDEGETAVNDQVTLKWTVSKRDLAVLRTICRTDISVPAVVQRCYKIAVSETREVLLSLGAAIDRLPL